MSTTRLTFSADGKTVTRWDAEEIFPGRTPPPVKLSDLVGRVVREAGLDAQGRLYIDLHVPEPLYEDGEGPGGL
jgi:hypothetical protein